jgi:hypothetical protein
MLAIRRGGGLLLHCWPCWPQGQPIGGEEARVFLHAWREKAQSLLYLAPRREPSIVAALKKEYQDFYKSIGLSRSAEKAKDAFGSANPSKKSKQVVSFLLFILLWF